MGLERELQTAKTNLSIISQNQAGIFSRLLPGIIGAPSERAELSSIKNRINNNLADAKKYLAELEAVNSSRLFAAGFPGAFTKVDESVPTGLTFKPPPAIDFGPIPVAVPNSNHFGIVENSTALILNEIVQSIQQINHDLGLTQLRQLLFLDFLSKREAAVKPSNPDKIKSVIPELTDIIILL